MTSLVIALSERMFVLEKLKLTLMQTLFIRNQNAEIVLCVVLVGNKCKLVDSQIVRFVSRQLICQTTNDLSKDKFLGPVNLILGMKNERLIAKH